MQQRTGSAPKKTKKAPPLKTGAFNAAADPFHVQVPGLQSKTPPKLKTPTAPFKPGTKPFAQRTAVQHNREVANTRERKTIANRALAQHEPAGVNPFGTHAGAKDKFDPALTAHAELAAADRTRQIQGGILSPAQLKRERSAQKLASVLPTFHDTHGLEPSLAAPGGNLRGRTPQGKEAPGTFTPQRARGFVTPGGGHFAKGAKDILSRAIGTGLEVGASVPDTFFTAPHVSYENGGFVQPRTPVEKVKPTSFAPALTDVTNRLNQGSSDLAGMIQGAGQWKPSGSVPRSWLDAESQAKLRPGVETVPVETLGAAYLNPEKTAQQRAKAIKRGWYSQELDGLNGLELMRRANSDPPTLALRLFQNTVGDVVRTAGVPAAAVGLATEAATGHGGRALDQLGGIAAASTIGVLNNPLESAVSHPLNFVPTVGAAGKIAGMAGLVRRGEMSARLIDTGLTHDIAPDSEAAIAAKEAGDAVPQTKLMINRGKYSRNLYDQAGQLVSDRFAKTRVGRRTALRKSLDTHYRNNANMNSAEHSILLHRYSKAQRGLASKVPGVGDAQARAEVLLALADSGGRPEAILEHYVAQAAKDGPKSAAAGQVKYIQQHLIGHELSAADKEFLQAHEALSLHNSLNDIEMQRFGPDAMEYRRHEALIRSAANRVDAAGNPLDEEAARAIHILHLRDELGIEGQLAKQGTGESQVRATKISEAERAADQLRQRHDVALERLNKAHDAKPPRPPKGSGKEAQASWRQANAAWKQSVKQANDRVAEVTVSRNAAEARVVDLHAQDEAAQPKVADLADVRDQYGAALRDFAQKHLEENPGAFTPHYVKRIQVTDAGTRPNWRENRSRVRFSDRIPRVEASTGATFHSGAYLFDSHSPVRDAIAGMRMRQSKTLFDTVVHHYAQRHEAGAIVPDGMVAVSEHSLTTLGRALRKLDENPVSSSGYYRDEANIRQGLEDAIKGQTTHERGATDHAGYFVPKDIYDRMLEYVKPESQSRYDRFLRQYQRALISTFPSTVVGNTLGSIPLAVASGAIHPQAYIDAWRAMHDYSLGPAALRGKGLAAGLASDAKNPIGEYMNFMRRQNVKGEDFSRMAAFFAKAGPHARAQAKELNMSVDDYLRKFVKGEIDPEALSRFLDHAEKFLGDTVKPNGELGRKASHFILFHNWVGHMMKVMLWTLPVEHPGRALLINILGQYGEQYRVEHGVWPQWMTNFVPLIHFQRMLPGTLGPQNYTLAGDATQFSPQGTAGGMLDTIGQDRPLIDNAAGVLAPPWGAGLKSLLQVRDAQNASANELNVPSWQGVFASNLLAMIPGERKFFPTTGLTADSTPWHQTPKMYRSAHGEGRVQSPFLAPGGKPLGSGLNDSFWQSALGTASRVAGFPLWTVPNEGATTRTEVEKQVGYQRKGGRAAAAAARNLGHLKAQYNAQLKAGRR